MSLILSPVKKLKIMGHLTEGQRYTIFAMQQASCSRKEICQALNKDKSVLSRELKRNCDKKTGAYNPELAQKKYKKSLKEKPKFVYFTAEIKQLVITQLEYDFSPEQIVGRAKREGKQCVSHETIYRFIWKDKMGGGELHKCLRNKGRRYRKRGANKDSRGVIKNRISIDERPSIVDEKTRFGDLEMDTVLGKNHKGAMLTITDRVSLMEWIVKLKGRNAEELAMKAICELLPYKEYIHTITSDNGKEFALHEKISKYLEVDFYFAHPYKPYERGCNENANRLIRQYFPKGTSFDDFDDMEAKCVQHTLNNRPRKKLDFLTPNEYFFNYFCHQKKLHL
jgi:IS30 family transposase